MRMFVTVTLCLWAWPLFAQDRFDLEIQQQKDAKKKAAEELREFRSIVIPPDVLATMQDRDWTARRNPTAAQAQAAEAKGAYMGKGKLTKIYFSPTNKAKILKFYTNKARKEVFGFDSIVITSPDGKQHEARTGLSDDDRAYVTKVVKEFAPKGIEFRDGKAVPLK